MFKGIFIALICMWFTVNVQARVSYPPEINPYKGLEKAISKMSKKERANTLAKIYDFMIKREDYQTVPIIVYNKEPIPDWLENLLWETSNAGAIASGHQAIQTCQNGPVTSTCPRKGEAGYDPQCVPGIVYPNSCMYAGNIICTRSTPPKCNSEFIQKEKPELRCENGDIKCNPDLFMTCADDKPDDVICVDAKRAEPNGHKGPKITKACITDYGKKTPEQRAGEVAQCADFTLGGGVDRALEEIAKFCSSLTSRKERGQYKKDFAGNDQDCDDMLKFIAVVQVQGQGHRPRENAAETPAAETTVTRKPPEPIKPVEPCNDFKELCAGQDMAGVCGSLHYNPDKKQVKECINVTITQDRNDAFRETPKICNDDIKDKSDEGRGRGLNWLHRPAKKFKWNDMSKIGRVASGSSDGHEKVETTDKYGNPTSFVNPFTEGLTDKRGQADLCWDSKQGKFLPRPKFFAKYLDKTIRNPAQKAAVDKVFNDCATRNNAELARQGIRLKKGMPADDIVDRKGNVLTPGVGTLYARAKTIWTMIKVDDVTNEHLAVRATTGRANDDSEPVCSPAAPCTEGTFVCAQTNNKMEIKDKVAEYVTVYSGQPNAKSEYGETQFVETGTYQTFEYDKNGKVKKDDDGRSKLKFQEYPVSATVYEAGNSKPFLKLKDPTVLKHEKRLWRDSRESVVYTADEDVCPNTNTNPGRHHNKVVASFAKNGEVEKVYVCDSTDGKNYEPWMRDEKAPRMETKDGQSSFKAIKAFNKDTGDDETFSLAFNANTPGNCIWKWADSDTPAALIREQNPIKPVSIRNNTRWRAPQSTDESKKK